MTFFKRLLARLLAGVIGAIAGGGIWYVAAGWMNEPLAWLGCLVGLTTGMGVRLATQESDRGIAPGLVSVAVGMTGILVVWQAILAETITVDPETVAMLEGAYRTSLNDESMIAITADAIALEREAAGKPIEWPKGMTYKDAAWEIDYPRDLWAAARERWEGLSPDEQAERRDEHEQDVRSVMAVQRREIGERLAQQSGPGSQERNSPWNIVWLLVAALTSFRLPAGRLSEL